MSIDVQADASAGIAVQLGRIANSFERAERWRTQCMGALQQVPIVTQQASGSAPVIDVPDVLMAKTGYCWSVRRLVAVGFTAGTVSVYRNANGGEILAAFTSAGIPQTYGRGAVLLMPGDRMVVVGAAVTGTVQLMGSADCMESWYLPIYIG